MYYLLLIRHHREMNEVVSELTDKYPDVYVRNLAQKHMEDKQVIYNKMIDSIIDFFFRSSQLKEDGIVI